MILDIFSIFDPHWSNSLLPIQLFLLLRIILITLIISPSINANRSSTSSLTTINLIFSQLTRTSSKYLKNLSLIITLLFLIIILTNLLGITPYIFRLSSHLIITLCLGLPIWISIIISRFIHNSYQSTAHLLPDGAPDWLNPFLVLIESTRVLVRPLTLSFRLAANITAGHVVLALISSYCISAILLPTSSLFILLPLSSAYILFEFAICLIQAYIFCLLLSLYSNDHAS